MNDETRSLAGQLALSMYANEPCRICRRMIERSDLYALVFAGYSRDGASRAAHRVCWDNFVEMLQTLPPQQLYELAADSGKESDENGKHSDLNGGNPP